MGFPFYIPFIVLGLLIFISAFFIVKQQTAVIIERFGKFQSIRHSGLQIKIPLVDRVAGRLSLKIQQLDVIVETKTLDDVFVRLKVSVQYKVIRDKVYDAFYKLDYPHDQITSYVFDVVRAEVPKMKLDDVFVKKDDIAIAVKAELNEALEYKLMTVQVGFTFHTKIISDNLTIDIGPQLQYNGKMDLTNSTQESFYVNGYDNVLATDISEISQFNVNGMVGASVGFGAFKVRAQYIYGFTNMLNKLNDAEFAKGLNTKFKGNQSMIAVTAMLTF